MSQPEVPQHLGSKNTAAAPQERTHAPQQSSVMLLSEKEIELLIENINTDEELLVRTTENENDNRENSNEATEVHKMTLSTKPSMDKIPIIHTGRDSTDISMTESTTATVSGQYAGVSSNASETHSNENQLPPVRSTVTQLDSPAQSRNGSNASNLTFDFSLTEEDASLKEEEVDSNDDPSSPRHNKKKNNISMRDLIIEMASDVGKEIRRAIVFCHKQFTTSEFVPKIFFFGGGGGRE
ncbi:hypothetical protein RFI_08695 [Reticulomyxa filosa]|uniref:Uncharacterized protein n=1 Tax=Reticulomyxa filosa TaxID=46433 RepID=X6NQ82_RETFI|nr:hypothetical protein RFI_08695 [Reticulomyxa filosa]|eukprot:ETO28435.1 hypothetical protein RFI_08695 [Reticulomyxa filosa]